MHEKEEKEVNKGRRKLISPEGVGLINEDDSNRDDI